MFDLVTVGHFAIDLIISPRITRSTATLGGSPTFCSIAAKKLGADVSVISKVGSDFPSEYIEWLTANGVDLSGLKVVDGASTTRFILKYEGYGRRLRLKSRAPPIGIEDIPDSLRSRAIHAGPIANELSAETISELRSLADVLSLDPQGLVRLFDREGNVSLRKMGEHKILRNIDIFKSATDELKSFVDAADLPSALKKISEHGTEIVIVTKGSKGALVYHRGRVYEIPACKPRVFVDATGAGDVFIGAFLAEYIRGKDVPWCACVGSASASFIVEKRGSSGFGERREVYERASKAFERVRTLRI
ncbi:MAG: carbohydrate kinase family protein [Candidatus Bathyarchaeia archaeon]